MASPHVKVYWFCLCFAGPNGLMVNTYAGRLDSNPRFTLPEIKVLKAKALSTIAADHLGTFPETSLVLSGVSYLGHMSPNEFSGVKS